MGYTRYDSIEAYAAAVEQAVHDTMRTDIANEAAIALQDAVETYVYDAYDPIFNHRRMEAGGLIDKHTYSPTYTPESMELKIEVQTQWQNIGFREIDQRGTYDELSEAIEKNDIYHAPPRPFAEHAEKEYGERRFERDLRSGLIKRGL